MKTFYFKTIFVSFLVVSISLTIIAQDDRPTVIPPSPESEQIHRFTDYPVSHYNGTADINVPIYTITAGDLSIPISLNYQTSGNRIQDESGSVGLGWSLLAGGRISRTIKGAPDEVGFEFKSANELRKSTSGFTVDEKRSLSSYLFRHERGLLDTENDIFSYSSPSINGSFILKQIAPEQFECLPIPFEPIKLDYTLNSVPKLFKTFQLKDELGTSYKYGVYDDGSLGAVERATFNNSPTSYLMAEAASANGKDIVQFSYQRRNPKGTSSPTFMTSRAFVDDKLIAVSSNGISITTPAFHTDLRGRITNYNAQTLSEITFKGGRVLFLTDSKEQKLKKVRVYETVGVNDRLIKEVELFYNEFGPHQHYTLQKVVFRDHSTAKVYDYKFNYFRENEAFPRAELTRDVDFWGYYNGAGNTYSFPASSEPPFDSYNGRNGNREANLMNLKHSILTDIRYPTGGRSEIKYEGNYYYNRQKQRKKQGGGLRVGSILYYDRNDDFQYSKEYTYGTAEDGIGIALVEPLDRQYISSTKEMFHGQFGHDVYTGSGVQLSTKKVLGSNSSISYAHANNPHIVYPQVTETLKGKRGISEGKTIYRYKYVEFRYNTSPLYQNDEFLFSYETIYENYGDEGKLLNKTVKDKDGNIVREESYIYQRYNEVSVDNLIAQRSVHFTSNDPSTGAEWNYVHQFIMNDNWNDKPDYWWGRFVLGGGGVGPSIFGGSLQDFGITHPYFFGHREINTGGTRMISKSIIEKDHLGKELKQTTNYFYDNLSHLFPTRIVTKSSAGDDLEQTVTYPQDYSNVTANFGTLVSNNILNRPIKSEETYSGNVINGSIVSYNNVGQQIAVYKYEQDILRGPQVFNPSTWLESGYAKRLDITYSDDARIKEVSPSDNAKTAYIWGYNKTLPIAKVLGSTIEKTAYSSFEDGTNNDTWRVVGNGTTSSDAVTGARSVQPYYLAGFIETTNIIPAGKYTVSMYLKNYNGSGGAVNVTGLNGAAPFWPGNNTWQYDEREITLSSAQKIKITPASNHILIDELRLYPVGAQMTSYTYAPLIGMTSRTDPNGVTTFYEYDNLGRLDQIKDKDGYVLKKYKYNYANSPLND